MKIISVYSLPAGGNESRDRVHAHLPGRGSGYVNTFPDITGESWRYYWQVNDMLGNKIEGGQVEGYRTALGTMIASLFGH